MSQHILITGGAGFIGSHLARELLRRGYRVRVLDNLSPQVHGPGRKRPAYLDPQAELMVGDVRDPDAVRRALEGVEAVYHLVAAVGVGQSMYQIADYTSTNNVGTAVLLEALIEKPVRRLMVASSRSIYGEGLYRAAGGGIRPAGERKLEHLRMGDFQVRDENGEPLTDGQLEDLGREEIRRRVEAFRPDFTVVATAPSYLFWRCAQPELRVPMETVQDLREVGGTMIAVGPHGSATPRPTLKKLAGDAVVLGECEEILPRLAGNWDQVPSLGYWRGGGSCRRRLSRADSALRLRTDLRRRAAGRGGVHGVGSAPVRAHL